MAPESAGNAKRMPALHSDFMTGWKPREGPCVIESRGARLNVCQAGNAKELCALQHMRNAPHAKFCVTICPGLV